MAKWQAKYDTWKKIYEIKGKMANGMEKKF